MKVKVLLSKKTEFPSYWTPVKIVVKGEEEKGPQAKGLNVRFTKVADKKLPVDFKGGIIEVKPEQINFPFIYEIKKGENGEDEYPVVWIRDIENVLPLPAPKNTCTFVGVEEDTKETEIDEFGDNDQPF